MIHHFLLLPPNSHNSSPLLSSKFMASFLSLIIVTYLYACRFSLVIAGDFSFIKMISRLNRIVEKQNNNDQINIVTLNIGTKFHNIDRSYNGYIL